MRGFDPVMASVAVKGVYRRFAALSDEEKAKVVQLVRQKLEERAEGKEGAGVSPDQGKPEPGAGLDPAEQESPGAGEETSEQGKDIPERPQEDQGKSWGEIDDWQKFLYPEDGSDGTDGAGASPDEKGGEDGGRGESRGKGSGPAPSPVGDVGDSDEAMAAGMADDVDRVADETGAGGDDAFEGILQAVSDLHGDSSRDVAGRVARWFMASRGIQVHRKDKDMISDTGGSSKGPEGEPEFKPPRDDLKKRFRSKDKPAEERDADVDSDPDMRRASGPLE